MRVVLCLFFFNTVIPLCTEERTCCRNQCMCLETEKKLGKVDKNFVVFRNSLLTRKISVKQKQRLLPVICSENALQ